MITCIGASHAQEQLPSIQWKAEAKKIDEKTYQLVFTTENRDNWEIYAPSADFDGLVAASITLPDSSIVITEPLRSSKKGEIVKSSLFDGKSFEVFTNNAEFTTTISFQSNVPANLQLNLSYTFGKKDSFYPGESTAFELTLEGGKKIERRMLIPGFDTR